MKATTLPPGTVKLLCTVSVSVSVVLVPCGKLGSINFGR